MANPTEQDYTEGTGLIAGQVFAEQVPLDADTYYAGMLLEYQTDVTIGDVVGDGDGTVDAVVAGADVKTGEWSLELVAALEAKLIDPDGYVCGEHITLTDGDSVTVKRAGMTITITDGATTPFSAGDTIAITIGTGGSYAALDKGDIIAIYNGPERTLSSAGYGSVLTGGEIYEGALVDASNSALTLTEAYRAKLRRAGFAPRKEA